MSTKQGNIGVTSQDIFPIIKKFLYSDHDIFLRELVSNAVDATQKLKTLASVGEFKGEMGDLNIHVSFDNDTIKVSDRGIGMTAEEIDKYINQIAFSGAEEFLEKYKNDAASIIGHFGLGFYSSFMVSKKVEIVTKSYKEGAVAMKWSCDGTPEFTLEEVEKADRGTDIILHIDDENKDFLNRDKLNALLTKYCHYLPVPIVFGKKQKWDKDKYVDTDEDNIINDIHPMWVRKPADLKDEDYKKFYHELYPMADDPLFWIHLNVDYPFNLKGILYFPKLKQDFGTHEGQIKLFSGQVFVADNIKEVIPEFLLLLKGVIDCPDLPLNVSRSFLQNDGYVRKISSYITKKVADKLTELFGGQRATYEGYWNDIAPFIKYGCMKDQKFFDSVKKVLLLKTTAGDYLTFEEYKTRNEAKAAKKVFYTNDAKRQAASVALYTERGIDVAVMDSLIDVNFMSFMEYAGGEDSVTFARVDADVSGLTEDSDEGKDLNAEEYEKLFRKALGKEDLSVKLEALANPDMIAMVTEDEQSRRFKEMSRLYGEKFPMPDQFTLVLNRRNATVRTLAARPEGEVTDLLCKQIYDLARMSAQPLESEEITDFIARSQKLVAMVADEK